MPRLIKNFIAGRWTDAIDGRRFTSRNPADNRETVAEAPLSGRTSNGGLVFFRGINLDGIAASSRRIVTNHRTNNGEQP